MSDSSSESPERSVPRLLTYTAAFGLGIFLSTIHWLGLLVGGSVLGLLAPSLRRGILYGAVFGVTVWLVFVLSLGWAGVVPSMDGIQVFGLSLVIPVVLGAVGGTAHELRPLVQGLISD